MFSVPVNATKTSIIDSQDRELWHHLIGTWPWSSNWKGKCLYIDYRTEPIQCGLACWYRKQEKKIVSEHYSSSASPKSSPNICLINFPIYPSFICYLHPPTHTHILLLPSPHSTHSTLMPLTFFLSLILQQLHGGPLCLGQFPPVPIRFSLSVAILLLLLSSFFCGINYVYN